MGDFAADGTDGGRIEFVFFPALFVEETGAPAGLALSGVRVTGNVDWNADFCDRSSSLVCRLAGNGTEIELLKVCSLLAHVGTRASISAGKVAGYPLAQRGTPGEWTSPAADAPADRIAAAAAAALTAFSW